MLCQDLGFKDQNEFKELLLNSNKSDKITENDFVNILLSQAGILEDYQMMNMNNISASTNEFRGNSGDIVKISDDEDSDFDLPGLRTHVYDFLELPDNYQKLEALKKLEEENLYDSIKPNKKVSKKKEKYNSRFKQK